MAFQVAQGFVEVASRFNERVIRRGADRVGRAAGGAFNSSFGRQTRSAFRQSGRQMASAFSGAGRLGRQAGSAFGNQFGRRTGQWFRTTSRRMAVQSMAAGRAAGRVFGQTFSRGAQAGLVRFRAGITRMFSRAGGDAGRGAGRQFGEQFHRDASGRLRDSRGRFARAFSGSGRQSGLGFSLGFLGAFRSQAGGIMSSFTGLFSKVGTKLPWLLVGGIIAALSALPALGATVATSLTFAFGAGIAGIGIFAAAQSDRVKKAFSGLADHVKSVMKRIAQPFEGTLVAIAGQARKLFDNLAPHLAKSFKVMAPAIELFAGKFFGALKALGPVIDVATQAFVRMLGPLSDAVGPAFKGLLDALKNMFATVRDSPELQQFFGSLVAGVINTVAGLIRFVTWLAKTYVWIGHVKDAVMASPIVQRAKQIGSALATAFAGFVSGSAPKVLAKAREIGSTVAGAFDRIKSQGGPKLESAFADIAPGFDGIGAKLRELGAAITDRVSDIAGKVKRLISAVGRTFAEFRDKHAEKFRQAGDKLGEIGRKIGEALGSAIEFITAVVNRIGSVLGFVLDVVMVVWRRFGDDILNVISIAFNTVLGTISGALTVVKGIFDVFTGILTGDWGKAWDGIKSIFSGLWQVILSVLKGGLGLVVQTVKSTISLIIWPFQWLYNKIVGNSIIPDLVNGVVSWFKNLVTWALAPIRWLRDRAVAIFTAARDWIVARAGNIRDWVVARITNLRDRFVLGVRVLRDRAVTIFTNARDWIVSRANNIRDWVTARVTALRNRVVAGFTNLRTRAVALFTNARDWIVSRASNLRDWVVSRITALRNSAVSRITSLRDRAVALATNLRDWVTSRAASLRDRVVAAFNALKDRTITAFSRAASGVRTVFDRLRSAASRPVRFVIETVYNQGIRRVWNNIAGKIPGVPGLPYMGVPRGFAKGGITDVRGGATLSGYSRTDDQLAMVRSGEGVLVPEAVRSLGAGFVHAANRLKGRAGEMLGIPGFDIGGIVGKFTGKAKGFFAGGFVKALQAALNPMVGMVTSRFGGRNDFPGLPGKMIGHLVGKAVGWLKQFADALEGGDGKKVVKVAEKYVGSGGNPNKWTRRMGMNGLPWCGMFVDGVFDEANSEKALKGVSNPAAVVSYRTLPRVSRSAAKAGDLGLYRGDSGHINIFTGRGSTTIGGNESNSVRRQSGYINSASSIRRPRFATGGIVGDPDLASFIWQDRAESDWFHTAERTRALRDAVALSGIAGSSVLRDMGGILPSGGVAVNASGQAEVVQTLDQLRAIVQAARGQQITYVFEEGSIVLDASKIKDLQDLLALIENLRSTARQHGAKVKVR